MISIALVLLLMVGINQVFKVTGETVGTSQTIADGVRDARGGAGRDGRGHAEHDHRHGLAVSADPVRTDRCFQRPQG